MRTATASLAATVSPFVSFAVALSFFALVGQAVAQDAAKAEPGTPAAKQSDTTSDRQQRRERRQAEAAAKQTEPSADEKSTTFARFPKAEEANAAAAKPKMECRKQAVTGSRLGRNICATPEEWARTDARAAEVNRQMRNEISEKSRIAGSVSSPLGGAGGR